MGENINELDLTTEEPNAIASFVSPSQKEAKREETRSHLSYWMMLILSVVVVFQGFLFFTEDLAKVKEFTSLVFVPIVTILGPILGFYFGSETRK